VLIAALGLLAAFAVVAIVLVVTSGGDGGEASSSTSAPVVTGEPVTIPQGSALAVSTLAYTSLDNGTPNIWLVEEDGTNARPLINGNSRASQQPVWSPDRRSILFTVDNAGSWELWVTDSEGQASRAIATGLAPAARATWSPDGSRVAVVREEDGQRDVYVLDLEVDELTRLTDTPAEEVDPAWSPEGSRLAFSLVDGGEQDIYVMPADGGEPARLTDTAGPDTAPAWHPAGTSLAFASQRDGNWNIYAMDVEGEGQRALTSDPADEEFPSWSPDGDSIAFQSSTSDGATPRAVVVAAGDGTGPRPLVSGEGVSGFPTWGWRALIDGAITEEIVVDSQVLWTDTEIVLLEGDRVAISADGEFADDVTRPDQVYDPDGVPRDPDNDIHFRDLWLDLPHGALIGRIDDGEPFLVGSSFEDDGLAAGRLYLGMNDGFAGDNTGTFTAQIEIRRFES
jgi:TolB protein